MSERRSIGAFGLLALIALMLLPAVPAAATSHGPGVFPPQSQPFGKSYGEWSALWWQQALAVDAGRHPNPFDQGLVPCNLGTSNVRFLVGTTGGDAYRACAIPAGKAILLPLINGECSRIEGNGTTEAELRACARAQADNFGELHARVDGRRIPDLARFRFASPLFSFRSVSGNPFAVPATPPGQPSPSVADGYWVMLEPLRPGLHTIKFGGAAPAFGFETSATYVIAVLPQRG